MTKDVISLSISVLLLFRHYISHKITFGAPSSGGVLCSACGAFIDDLMTEAKCDQRIADLFTKGSHHRNISIVYLTQNVFPQGKACRDIALNFTIFGLVL